MFTVYHFVWLAIRAAVIAGALAFLQRRRPPLKSVLSICCVLCVLPELVKDLSVIKMVPSADGSMLLPYMEMQHLPFHLCSIQILLIFFVRFARPGKASTMVLAFMYPTALIGAALALAMASLYLNSMFAAATYEDGELISVEYATNFFFTYKPPLPIPLTSVGQWLAYLAVICLLAAVLVGLCYLPVLRRAKKEAEASS